MEELRQLHDQLFEAVKALDWQKFIPVDGKFWVKKAGTVKSKLFSPSDIQRIVKKAIVEKLKMEYHESWFAEDGAEYPIRVFFYKDEAVIRLENHFIKEDTERIRLKHPFLRLWRRL